MPLAPPSGPISQDAGFPEFLAGPPVDLLREALKSDFPKLAALSCIVSGIPDTRNPIKISLNTPQKDCATNTTQPGHVLDNMVIQCLTDIGSGVYSNITGMGPPTARLAGLNEKVGPLILGTVRDQLRSSVSEALASINGLGLCCQGRTLLGGVAMFHDDGSLSFVPSGTPGSCGSDGGMDASIDGADDTVDARDGNTDGQPSSQGCSVEAMSGTVAHGDQTVYLCRRALVRGCSSASPKSLTVSLYRPSAHTIPRARSSSTQRPASKSPA